MTRSTERIVVGLDDSAGGRAALAFAIGDAARRGAAVVEVVTAFEIPGYWEAVYGAPPATNSPSIEQVRDAVQGRAGRIVEYVSKEAAAALPKLPPVTVTAVGAGAADALLRAARGADLLVLGSRGRGGFTSMLLGSVSLQCVLHATCPVTVVPSSAVEVAEQVHEMSAPAPA
jgi:nucleotide-binding universal stress UspA family protein